MNDLTLRDRPSEWAAVATAAGVAPEDLLLIRQVHEARVAVASADRPRPWPRPESDVLVSDDPGAALVVRIADCVPILLADDEGRTVAAVHAGWRGTAMRAAIAAVQALQEHYGVRPERLIAAIGPSIGPCCYEVGKGTRQAYREAGHHHELLERWFAPAPAGKYQLDLWLANRDQLEGAGIMPGNIHDAGLCTRTHADVFHSYRAHGAEAGRMAAVIRGGTN